MKDDFIFGIHSVSEAILAGRTIDKVLMSRTETESAHKPLVRLIREHSLTLIYVPQEKLDRITTKNHQGVIAYLSPVQFADIEDVIDQAFVNGKMPFILALDRITDMRNFGAMVRSAECAGVDAILVPTKGSAQIGSDAVKTSAGALHHLPVCKTTNLAQMLRKLKSAGLR
ncbi:MAG: 23S rRNA (guanosine(2251)-2'-O)-methyltransferase RlmB, partial [Bacteroidetes bacterium]